MDLTDLNIRVMPIDIVAATEVETALRTKDKGLNRMRPVLRSIPVETQVHV